MSESNASESKVFSVAHTKSTIIPRNVPGVAWGALGVAWISYGAQSAIKTCVFVLMGVYAVEFNLSPITLMIFPFLFTLLQGPLAPSLSHKTDKLGGGWSRRHITIFISAVYVLVSFAISQPYISANALVFGILIVLLSLSVGPCEPLVCAMAGDWFPMENRGFALGFHHTGYPWGSFVSGMIISVILGTFGNDNWRIAFLLMPLFTVVVIWWFRYQITLKQQHKLIEQAKKLDRHISIADEVLPDEVNKEQKEEIPLGEVWKMTVKNPTAFVTILTGMLTCGTYWVWAGWLPLYILNIGGYTASQTAAFSVVFAITGGVGQIVWGAISDRMGRKLSMMIICIWTIVGYYCMQFSLVSVAALVGFQLFIGLVTNAPFPLLYAIGYDVADAKAKGASMGFIDVSFYVGAVFLFLTGILIQFGGGFKSPTGYMWTLYMMMGLYGLAFILTLVFARETKGWFFKRDWSLFPRSKSNIPEL